MEADMKGKLQNALQKQTIALSNWTWAFCFICMIQTGYILFMNSDVAKTIPQWFKNRWENGYNIAEMIVGLYQWCYGYLTDYMHPYVVIGVMVIVSVGIVAVGFVLLRNMLDWLSEKWHDRWQYYEVYGEIRLRKAVSVALCIVSVTFALIAGKYIPIDIYLLRFWVVLANLFRGQIHTVSVKNLELLLVIFYINIDKVCVGVPLSLSRSNNPSIMSAVLSM